MAKILRISTSGVAPRERYSFWTDAYSRQLVGMSTDHGTVDPGSFAASVEAVIAGNAASLSVKRSPGVTRRTERDIAGMPMGAVLIYRTGLARTWFKSGDTEFVAPKGTMVLGMSDVPFDTTPTDGQPYDCRLIRLPLALLGPQGGLLKSRRPIIAPSGKGFGALFSSYVASWNAQLPHLDDDEATAANLALANLAAVAFGMADIRSDLARDAIRTGRMDAALRFAAANLARFDLTPDMVAAHLGISTRQLHLDFEPTGRSMARRILAMRVERAAHYLVSEPTRSIADIAYSCGFDALSTFYRAFKAMRGMTATEYREASRRH